ncbi:glycosyltransferase family 39 protein [Candidatus Woesearchaeota archaeon]|nr:glycosyltransferase family 39 protein [Candidatus Woesearchaeota archaeon]
MSGKKNLFKILFIMTIIYLIFNSYFMSKNEFIGGADDVRYAIIAKNIASGRGYVVDVIHKFFYPYPRDVTHQDDLYAPLYPYIVAFFYTLFGAGEFFSKFPALVFGLVGIPLMIFLIAKEIYNEKIALVAGLASMLNPSSFSWTGTGDTLYAFLTVCTIYCFIKAGKDKRWFYLMGLCLGLSYLAKITAAVVVIAVVLAYIINYRKNLIQEEFIVGMIIALAIVSPWLVRNYFVTGSPTGSLYSYYPYMFKYFENSHEITSKVYWGQRIGLDWFLSNVGIQRFIESTLAELLKTCLAFSLVVPTALIGTFLTRRKEKFTLVWTVFLMFFLAYTIYYPFNMRYYIAMIPLFSIPIFYLFMNRIPRKYPDLKKPLSFLILVGLMVLLLFNISRFFVFYTYFPPSVKWGAGYPRTSDDPFIRDRMEMISWIDDNLPENSTMMVCLLPHPINFYTNIKSISVPFEPIDKILYVADYYNVDYISCNKELRDDKKIQAIEDLKFSGVGDTRFELIYDKNNEMIYRINWQTINRTSFP